MRFGHAANAGYPFRYSFQLTVHTNRDLSTVDATRLQFLVDRAVLAAVEKEWNEKVGVSSSGASVPGR